MIENLYLFFQFKHDIKSKHYIFCSFAFRPGGSSLLILRVFLKLQGCEGKHLVTARYNASFVVIRTSRAKTCPIAKQVHFDSVLGGSSKETSKKSYKSSPVLGILKQEGGGAKLFL